jgi:hypothetical protein
MFFILHLFRLLCCLARIPHTMTHHLQHTLAVERLLLEHVLRLHPILRREKNGCRMAVSHRARGNDLSGFHQSPHIVEMRRRESPTIRRILTEFRKDQHSLRASHARWRPPSLGKSNRTDHNEQECPHGSIIASRQCRRTFLRGAARWHFQGCWQRRFMACAEIGYRSCHLAGRSDKPASREPLNLPTFTSIEAPRNLPRPAADSRANTIKTPCGLETADQTYGRTLCSARWGMKVLPHRRRLSDSSA